MPKLIVVSDRREPRKQVIMVGSLNAIDPQTTNHQGANVLFLQTSDLAQMQRDQHLHDSRNHQEIACLHKNDRLKHYGLHFCKYVGRLARGASEQKSVERTLVDSFLVSLSSSNALQEDLSKISPTIKDFSRVNDSIAVFADAAGRYADACEKIDHLEEFIPIVRRANVDIVTWVLSMANSFGYDLPQATSVRRAELAKRPFYIQD